MKAHLATIVACFALATAMQGAEPAKLEMHEWGTFTVASGSDGVPLQWYLPYQSVAELPPFVRTNHLMLGKGALHRDFVRMETPVIYFYPGQAMEVSVSVSYRQGRLTEWFPAPFDPGLTMFGMTPGVSAPDTKTVWKGELIAPDNATAAAQVPAIQGTKGAHYGHAREVPQAWYFHALKSIPSTTADEEPTAAPYEKFIFYRGAGETLPTLAASAPEDRTLALERHDEMRSGPVVAFALQVEGDQARWAQMTELAAANFSQGGGYPKTSVQLDGAPQSIAQVKQSLGAAMEKALASAGLSTDEATAMVATWSDTWFAEGGTRILALLPRPWVDQVLPLQVTPEPQKLTRVFVGRFEIFTPSREKALLSLLESRDQVGAPVAAEFRNLHLGRFGYAALQRVKFLQEQRASWRFEELQQAAALKPATAAR